MKGQAERFADEVCTLNSKKLGYLLLMFLL